MGNNKQDADLTSMLNKNRITPHAAPKSLYGATRHNTGKPRLSLVLEFGRALEEATKGLEEGADKYGRGNWRKGLPYDEVMDSLLRHLTKMVAGEVIDPDSPNQATHAGKVLCNALMLVELYPDGPPDGR